MVLEIMNPAWLIAFAFCFIIARKILPITRQMLWWISAGPIIFESFEIDELPQPLRDRLKAVTAELTLIGFREIGSCRRRINKKRTVCYVVLIRNDTIADVSLVIEGDPRRVGITVAIGQEYMDLTNIVVVNSRPSFLGERDGEFHLSGVRDLSRLHEVSQAIIANKRGNRLPYIPASAIEYKTKDTQNWLDEIVNAEYFCLDSKRNCYRSTWRYLSRALMFQLSNLRIFRRGNDKNTKKMIGLLEELGLREPRPKAFPVIFDSSSSSNVQTTDNIPPVSE
jgi:hypothetical protein